MVKPNRSRYSRCQALLVHPGFRCGNTFLVRFWHLQVSRTMEIQILVGLVANSWGVLDHLRVGYGSHPARVLIKATWVRGYVNRTRPKSSELGVVILFVFPMTCSCSIALGLFCSVLLVWWPARPSSLTFPLTRLQCFYLLVQRLVIDLLCCSLADDLVWILLLVLLFSRGHF